MCLSLSHTKGLPGFEPGLLDSESKVITNYTIGPRQWWGIFFFLSLSFFVTLRRPGIEPGPRAWKARILTIELSAHAACVVRERERECVCGERESERKKIFFFW